MNPVEKSPKPEETVSEPCGIYLNPVSSKQCVNQGEIALFFQFFECMAHYSRLLLINAVLIFTARSYQNVHPPPLFKILVTGLF